MLACPVVAPPIAVSPAMPLFLLQSSPEQMLERDSPILTQFLIKNPANFLLALLS
jgi:hypothetical protein